MARRGGDAARLHDGGEKLDVTNTVRHAASKLMFPNFGIITSFLSAFERFSNAYLPSQAIIQKEQTMRAIRFKSFGDPSVLKLVEADAPSIDGDTALVRVAAASVNPSDVKNVGGAMKQTTLPRIPGRDYAGVVEQGPAEWIGAAVWGTGGDTGFTRDGTHSGMIAVPVASLRRKPDTLRFDEAASVGVNYVAAWC